MKLDSKVESFLKYSHARSYVYVLINLTARLDLDLLPIRLPPLHSLHSYNRDGYLAQGNRLLPLMCSRGKGKSKVEVKGKR